MSENVIQFNKVKGRHLNRVDKRLHPRLEIDDRLFAQVVLSADQPELVGTTLACTAVDMSIGGIQFKTSELVPVATLLDLWVDAAARPGKFFLAGEVRWNRLTGESDANGVELYFVGVQLKTGAATDIQDWRDFHSTTFAR